MDADKIPQLILEKHPELIQILDAIKIYREGRPITGRCTTCNELLEVTEVPDANSLWVTCGKGCTNYREKYNFDL